MAADHALRARAHAVLPSLTHLSVRGQPANYSQFYISGKGSHVVDADGKDFIDYMCSCKEKTHFFF